MELQPQGHAQVVINLIDFGMNLQLVMLKNTYQQPTGGQMSNGGELALETGFDYEVIRTLMGYGHTIISSPGSFGGYQAIMKDHEKGVYFGASESRKDGCAIGY